MTQEEIQSRLTSFPSFLDWERAQRECWPIRTIRASAAELRAFYTLWYAGPNGPLADSVEMRGRTLLAFQMPGARPVPVGQVAVTLDAWIETERAAGYFGWQSSRSSGLFDWQRSACDGARDMRTVRPSCVA